MGVYEGGKVAAGVRRSRPRGGGDKRRRCIHHGLLATEVFWPGRPNLGECPGPLGPTFYPSRSLLIRAEGVRSLISSRRA